MGSTLTSASSLTSLQTLAPLLESKSCAVPRPEASGLHLDF